MISTITPVCVLMTMFAMVACSAPQPVTGKELQLAAFVTVAKNGTAAAHGRQRRVVHPLVPVVAGCLIGGAVFGVADYIENDKWMLSAAEGCAAGAGLVMMYGTYKGRRKRQSCIRKREAIDNLCEITAAAFVTTDQDNDGLVHFSELKLEPGIDILSAQEFYKLRDVDGDGYWSPEEVHTCLANENLSVKARRVKRCSDYTTQYYTYPSQSYVVYI